MIVDLSLEDWCFVIASLEANALGMSPPPNDKVATMVDRLNKLAVTVEDQLAERYGAEPKREKGDLQ